MHCPNCQAELREGAAFCTACGAATVPTAPDPTPVGSPAPPPPPPAPQAPAPAPAPETPAPQALTAPEPMSEAAYAEQQAALADQQRYERELAEYERQKAAYDRQQTAVAPPVAYAQSAAQSAGAYGQPFQAPKKRKTGLVIGLVIGALLLCGALGAAGFFAWKAWSETAGDTGTPSTVTEPTVTEPVGSSGFATAEEAMLAELEAADAGDWAYQLYREGETEVTYWVGPPQSEYAEEIVVTKNADGTWAVTKVNAIEFGGDVPEGSVSAQDEALMTVEQFLYAVQDDRGEDAHALTVEPFANDAASAQVSAGMFDTFEISGAVEQSDGSYWVETVQVWSGAEERWQYLVIATQEGYRIADLQPW